VTINFIRHQTPVSTKSCSINNFINDKLKVAKYFYWFNSNLRFDFRVYRFCGFGVNAGIIINSDCFASWRRT
jgi:hypothetical protein